MLLAAEAKDAEARGSVDHVLALNTMLAELAAS